MKPLALLVVLVGIFPPGVHADDKPLARAEIDERIHKQLRDIINRGATIHNNGDVAGCYRIYQGALMAIAPMLDHRSALQAAIAKGLKEADQMPDPSERAFALRAVIDVVRADLKPIAKPLPPAPKEPGKDK